MGWRRALIMRRSGLPRWQPALSAMAAAAVVAGTMVPLSGTTVPLGGTRALLGETTAAAATREPATVPPPAPAAAPAAPAASAALAAPAAPAQKAAAPRTALPPPAAPAPQPAAEVDAAQAVLVPAASAAGSYTLSGAVYQFLAGALHVPLPGRTLTGTLSGSTLTVATGPLGALPLADGIATPSFGPVTITIDLAAKTLTLAAAVTVSGATGTLTVAVDAPGTATLTGTAGVTGTLRLTGVPFIGGATTALTGTVGHTGGALSWSLSGSTEGEASFGEVSIRKGATVALATSGPFTVKGTADIGPPGGTTFAVHVSGSLTNKTTWSLAASETSTAPWTPVTGLSVVPNFSGTVADKSGTVSFTLTAGKASSGPLLTWQPDSPSTDPTVTLASLQVSNAAPSATSPYDCASDVTDGQVWIGAAGTLSDATTGLALPAAACVDATTRHFTVTTTAAGDPSSGLFGTGPFSVTDASLTASYDGTTFDLSGSADLTVNATASSAGFTTSIGLEARSDGTVIAAATLQGDAATAALGDVAATAPPLPGQQLVVYAASKAVTDFHPGSYRLPGPDFPASVPLQRGVTVAYAGSLPTSVSDALRVTAIPASAKVVVAASLTASGFSFNFGATFGSDEQGLQLLNTNGTAVYFDDVDFSLVLGDPVSFDASGDAWLELPPLVPGGDATSTGVTVTGSLEEDGEVALGLTLTKLTDALGITGLSADALGVRFGFEPETLTPTLTLTADGVRFPGDWKDALGLADTAVVTADASFDPAHPYVNFSITAPGDQAGATVLYPLAVAYGGVDQAMQSQQDTQVIDSLEVSTAQLYLAPDGGTTSNGVDLTPGINVAFAANVAGEHLSVMGSVGVSPPSLSVNAAADPLSLGQLTLGGNPGPSFYINASVRNAQGQVAPSVSMGFSGSVSDRAAYDSSAGFSFSANVALALGRTSLAGATVNLTLQAGLPSYLSVDGQLSGQVSVSYGGQVSFSASGSGSFTYTALNGARHTLGGATFSVNSASDGFNWGNDASLTAIIQFFTAAANPSNGTSTAEQILQHLGLTPYQILNAFGLAGVSGPQVLSDLTTFFGAFSNTYFNLWVDPSPFDLFVFPLVAVADGSQAPGHQVIDWSWEGKHYEQEWEFLPASVSGSYEIVNRNSGQCLTVTSPAEGTSVVQYPCTDITTQFWRLSTGTPQQGPRFTIQNVYSGYFLDVAGASPNFGTGIDQWQSNGGINQKFWITEGTN